MQKRVILYVLGRLILAEAVVLLVPCGIAIYNQEHDAVSFLSAAMLAGVAGHAMLYHGNVRVESLSLREGIAITGLGWIMATALGMLPYVSGGYLGLLDGLFESISGFTGTGATVFPTLQGVPQSILFWRMMTHWFGGLGIIVIFIAILPQTGASAVYMYNAEGAGPTDERVLPRLRDMTKALFKLYLVFTLLAFLVYVLCGLRPFEALAHAMSTIGTGGFSTYDDNAMHFRNAWLEGWMTFFMILAGGNFALYYRVWHKGPRVLLHNTEFKAYLGIIGSACLLITLNLIFSQNLHPAEALRYSSFQVGSISTTGFVSADFEQWPPFAKGVLLLLMLGGGCAGSTASGMKISRLVMLAKNVWSIVRQKNSPRMVAAVRMNGVKVDEGIVERACQFFFLYIMFIMLWTLLLTADGISTFDALGLSVTTMGNIGPAFGIAGATQTYAGLSDFTKSVLCFSMLFGRLEILTLLVMCRPSFWRATTRW